MPNHSETQEKSARKLHANFISKNVYIIKDETYIKYNRQLIPGAVYYISNYRGKADKKFKYIKHDKLGLKKPLFGKLFAVVAKNQHLISVSPHLLVKYMLKSAYKNVFYLLLNHMIMDQCSGLIWL